MNTFFNFSPFKSSSDMAASHAFHLSEIISNICEPWCFTTAERWWSITLSLLDLLEQPMIAQMTIVITKNQAY